MANYNAVIWSILLTNTDAEDVGVSPLRPLPDSPTLASVSAAHQRPESPRSSSSPFSDTVVEQIDELASSEPHTHTHGHVIDDVTRKSLETLKAINNKSLIDLPKIISTEVLALQANGAYLLLSLANI